MAVKVEETNSKKGKAVIISVVVVLVICLALILIALTDSTGIRIGSEPKYVEISESDSVFKIADKLEDEGIIKYPAMFVIQSYLGGYQGHFEPGSATVVTGMSYNQILDLLITPSRNVTKVVIPAGCEIREIAVKLCDLGLTTWDEFYAALENVSDYNYRFLSGIPVRENMLEGYLYPATYEIPEGTSAHDIVDLMLSTFDAQFKDEYYTRVQELGMTVDEAITMASVVERETSDQSDLKKAAGVYHNKKNAGMYFESNASVQYVLGERKPILSIMDTKVESAYNTYSYPGLPTGPIGNPDIEAIEAVLDYSATDAYYYALTKNGEQLYGTNYQEFKNLVDSTELAVTVDSDVIKNQDDKIPQ